MTAPVSRPLAPIQSDAHLEGVENKAILSAEEQAKLAEAMAYVREVTRALGQPAPLVKITEGDLQSLREGSLSLEAATAHGDRSGARIPRFFVQFLSPRALAQVILHEHAHGVLDHNARGALAKARRDLQLISEDTFEETARQHERDADVYAALCAWLHGNSKMPEMVSEMLRPGQGRGESADHPSAEDRAENMMAALSRYDRELKDWKRGDPIELKLPPPKHPDRIDAGSALPQGATGTMDLFQLQVQEAKKQFGLK